MLKRFTVDCWDELTGRWREWTRLSAYSWADAEAICRKWNPKHIFRAT